MAGQGINWSQFPDFSLPFKVVYGGSPSLANVSKMLNTGFTHFSGPENYPNLIAANRACIFYNVGSPDGSLQPWQTVRSPWNNDMMVYENFWNSRIQNLKNATHSSNSIDSDILLFDIEQQLKSDADILNLKNDINTPSNLKVLSDVDFILKYKKDLQNLYALATNYIIQKGQPTAKNIGSYGDAPVWNTFTNIEGKTWTDWTSNKSVLNYLNFDFANNTLGSDFYKNQSIVTPSSYFYYDYPHPFSGEYLAYLLFQIEVNQAWTNKDQMVFLWQKYSDTPSFVGKNIKSWMAESMAIFPFFAGAKGIWLWEDLSQLKANDDFSNYEYFTKGLYRLSKFKNYFAGNYTLVHEVSARDYDVNKTPIWRGVLNNGKILIVAQNPWAQDEVTKSSINIKYQNLSTTINLTGHELLLCEFDLNILGIDDESDNNLIVYANPASENLHLKLKTNGTDNRIEITDMMGKLLFEQNIASDKNELTQTISLKNIHASEILVNYTTGTKRFSKKVVITK